MGTDDAAQLRDAQLCILQVQSRQIPPPPSDGDTATTRPLMGGIRQVLGCPPPQVGAAPGFYIPRDKPRDSTGNASLTARGSAVHYLDCYINIDFAIHLTKFLKMFSIKRALCLFSKR